MTFVLCRNSGDHNTVVFPLRWLGPTFVTIIDESVAQPFRFYTVVLYLAGHVCITHYSVLLTDRAYDAYGLSAREVRVCLGSLMVWIESRIELWYGTVWRFCSRDLADGKG